MALAALEARLARDEAQQKATTAKLARVIRQGMKVARTQFARVQF
jgi:hypothetical protein